MKYIDTIQRDLQFELVKTIGPRSGAGRVDVWDREIAQEGQENSLSNCITSSTDSYFCSPKNKMNPFLISCDVTEQQVGVTVGGFNVVNDHPGSLEY